MGVAEDRIETSLRRTFDAVAARVGPPDEDVARVVATFEPSTTQPAARGRSNQRRLAVLVAAVLVFVCLVGGGILLALGSGNKAKVSVGADGTQATEPAPSKPYAVPADTSAITEIGITEAPTGPVPTLYQQMYDGSMDGVSVHLVLLMQIFPPSSDQRTVLGLCTPDAMLQVNGHTGCAYGVQQATEHEEAVVWQEEQDVQIQLNASGLSRDQILAIANDVKRSPDGARVELDPVPDGLHPSGTDTEPKNDGPMSITIQFTEKGCDYGLTRTIAPSVGGLQGQGIPTTIGSYSGYIIGAHAITWAANGSLFTLGTMPESEHSACDVAGTAANLHYLSETAWTQLLGDLRPLVKRNY